VSHEEAAHGLSRGSDVLVASTAEPLVEHGVDVVAQGGHLGAADCRIFSSSLSFKQPERSAG
jgi:hypothetical protein